MCYIGEKGEPGVKTPQVLGVKGLRGEPGPQGWPGGMTANEDANKDLIRSIKERSINQSYGRLGRSELQIALDKVQKINETASIEHMGCGIEAVVVKKGELDEIERLIQFGMKHVRCEG